MRKRLARPLLTGTGRNAQHIGACKRVAEQRLHQHAGHRKGSTGQNGCECFGQAMVEYDFMIDSIGIVPGQRVPHGAERQISAPEKEVEEKEQPGQCDEQGKLFFHSNFIM